MSGKQFSTLTVFSMTGLVSALWILATCQPTPPESLTSTLAPTLKHTATPIASAFTPVPIATWVAQGIPGDTRIYYHSVSYLLALAQEISITADGSATYYESHFRDAEAQSYTGRLSAEALKRVVLAFEEYSFFTLTADSSGCVIDMTQPPAPSATFVWITDAPEVSISITINGLSKSLDYDAGCRMDSSAQGRLGAIHDVLVNAVKDLPAATPTASP